MLDFHNESSAISCAQTLNSNGITVTDIQNLLLKKIQLENAIITTIKDAEFPYFVAQVEASMKNETRL